MGTTVAGRIHQRPPYVELTPSSDVSRWDLVELKYDGQWGQLVLEGKTWEMWSQHGQMKARGTLPHPIAPTLLHGEFMFGSNWAFRFGMAGRFCCFDATEVRGSDVRQAGLLERRRMAYDVLKRIRGEETLKAGMVDCLGASHWRGLWDADVQKVGWEGLVFKHSTSPFGAEWGRMKRRDTMDYVCMGFGAGGGKYTGLVGSVTAGLWIGGKLEVVGQVCGIDEEQRRAFQHSPSTYIGRVFEASGRGIFGGRMLRHAAFERWREDKLPAECLPR